MNQWQNPLKLGTGSNLVDMGRAAVHGALCGASTPKPDCVVGGEATEKACGVPVARLQGHSWAPTLPIGSW